MFVVDDEAEMRATTRMVVEDYLRRQGYAVEIREAHDGMDAMYQLADLAAEDQKVNLIITDHQMPRMSGKDLVEYLRTVRSPLRNRLIVVTASNEPHDYFLRHEIPVVSKLRLASQLPNTVDLMLLRD